MSQTSDSLPSEQVNDTHDLTAPVAPPAPTQAAESCDKASTSTTVVDANTPTNGGSVSSQLPPEAEYQWIFSKSDLLLTPSVLVGKLQPDHERQLRAKGISTLYKIGDYMRLGQHVLSTACIFFHRFYMRKPLQYGPSRQGFSHYEMAATCVFLACKVEEAHRKLPTIIDATMASLDKSPEGVQKWTERSFRANPQSKEYARWRDIILVSEEILLESLAFDLIVEHPHEILVKATYRLGVESKVTRLAWTMLNDSMRDPTCVMFEAPVLAAGAFKGACAKRNVDPSTYKATHTGAELEAIKLEGQSDAQSGTASRNGKQLSWTDVFDVDDDEAAEASKAIQEDVYGFHNGQHTPVSYAQAEHRAA